MKERELVQLIESMHGQLQTLVETSAADTRRLETLVETSAADTRRLETLVETSAADTRRLETLVETSAADTRRLETLVETSAADTRRLETLVETSAARLETLIEASAADNRRHLEQFVETKTTELRADRGDELQTFRDELRHQFTIVVEQMQHMAERIAEAVVGVDEKHDRKAVELREYVDMRDDEIATVIRSLTRSR